MHRAAVRVLVVLSLLALPLLAGCDDYGTAADGPYTLTFEGDASFQGPHGGQTIRAALVPFGGGPAITQTGTVSATVDPSFTFTFAGELEAGTAYEVHYWIDSNFGGGGAGVCDPPSTDHQWSETVGTATDDVTLTVAHDPSATTAVCETFAYDLTFNGDASFQGPHGLQPVTLALVREDGSVAVTARDTVSPSQDPSFSITFPTALLPGESYAAHLWIDSNFGGGGADVCDPPAIDHQWAIDIGIVSQDRTIDYAHDPGATTDVCDTFD